MDRRQFLSQSALVLFGTFGGLNSIAKALAVESQPKLIPTNPRITLIIDDIGHSQTVARRFLNLNIPLTFAVLPHLRYSKSLAHEGHAQGHEILLHQPMEPCRPDCDPGPGALYVGFEPQKIALILTANIEAVPHVVGVNNHMGSRFTASPHEVDATLRYIKQKGLFFVDSVTTRHTQAFKTARKLQMAAASRNVFIDYQRDQGVILTQLRKLERHAYRHGCAVGIGHPYPETVETLARFWYEHRDPDIEWVPVSTACWA